MTCMKFSKTRDIYVHTHICIYMNRFKEKKGKDHS